MSKYIFLLFLLFSLSNHSTANQINKKTTEQLLSDQKLEKEDMSDKLIVNLEKTLVSDPKFKKVLSKEIKEGFDVIESDDKQIRIVSWKSNNEWNRILQFKVANKVSRYVHYNDQFYNSVPYDFIDINLDPQDELLKIYKLQTGIYMFETVRKSESMYNIHKLLGVDISRGIIKKAYLFTDESERPSNTSNFETRDTLEDKYKFIVDDWNLKIPDIENREYLNLFYNGANYIDADEYEKQRPFLDKTSIYFSRLYFKDVENRKAIFHTQNASDNISLTIDLVQGKGKIIRDTLAPILLRSSESNEHKSGELFTYYLKLKPINNQMFIENASLYNIPFEIMDTTQDNTLSKVVFCAGKNEALVYETLRYTAMAFNCILNGNDDNKIKWVVLVNNKLEKLKGRKYQGVQIDLQMKKKWIDKEIIVIPYINGFEIDKEVGIKTKVKTRYDLEDK